MFLNYRKTEWLYGVAVNPFALHAKQTGRRHKPSLRGHKLSPSPEPKLVYIGGLWHPV